MVGFAAFYADGTRDRRASGHRGARLRPVVLPARTTSPRERTDPRGIVVAVVGGFYRDESNAPDGLCRRRDERTPAVLVLTVGTATFRVANSDPSARQVKAVFACLGRITTGVPFGE